MKLPICDRLLTCCKYITGGVRVADIGTDHGYLGIYLLQNGLASFVIASDVNQHPLESSIQNAAKYGVRNKMSFHLSDGVQNIPKDFDIMVCAGMGADTIIHILNDAPWLKDRKYRLILQCQSKRPDLRQYLAKEGYQIIRETLVKDGRFIYTVMEAQYSTPKTLTPGECYLSKALMADFSPLLPEFYERVMQNLKTSIEGMTLSTCENKGEKLFFYQKAYTELSQYKEEIYGNCS